MATNRALLRIEGAAAGSVLGLWAFGVALSVYAYRAGGASALGLLILLRLLPAVVVAPLAGIVADRYRREHVMIAADLSRAVVAGVAAAALAAGAAAWTIYALTVLIAVLSSVFRPAESAILPSLARSPEELTAANVVASTIESAGMFAGPALGGLLLVVTSTAFVVGVTAATFLWSAALIAGITTPARQATDAMPRFHLADLLPGVRAIVSDERLRLVAGLYLAQSLVIGATDVLIVAAALNLLDLGNAGVGYLTSALGVGALLGAAAAMPLVGNKGRLTTYFGTGILLLGLPLVLIGIWPWTAAALVFLALTGVGDTLVEVTMRTLLQTTVPDDVLGRAFGVLGSMLLGAIALGAVGVPLLIATLGIRGAFVGTGLVLPALLLVFGRRLVALETGSPDRAHERDLLLGVPIFAPLPPAAIAALTTKLTPTTVDAGELVFSQGDGGDRFYVIDEGAIDISVDGNIVGSLGPGDFFGEIALLREDRRTASATAQTGAKLLALDREDFIAAVTGNPASSRAADAAISARLATARPVGVTV